MNIEDTIIEQAEFICKTQFMDYPDFDEEVGLTAKEAITVLLYNNLKDEDDEINEDDLYDFLDSVIN